MQSNGTALAKLTRPRLFDAVQRKRLFGLIDELLRHPCIWISGPPGAGKTTLVASWLETRGVPTFWYDADAGDADPAAFFDYLAELARPLLPPRAKRLPYLTPEYLRDLPGFARRFFRRFFAALPPGALLVIDNHHAAAGHPFDALLREAVGEVPGGAHLIVVSRTEVPSQLLRGVANGLIACIGWNDIRMTPDETAALVRVRFPHASELAAELHAVSGGWAAGVVLMSAVRRGEAAPGRLALQPEDVVFAYFAGEVLDRTAPADCTLLLKTSCFPQFTPEMARMLTGHPDADAVLDALYRGHYFTERRHAAEPIYRYHDLFRAFLKERARRVFGEGEWKCVLVHAARILEDRGEADAAADLLQQARDWPRFAIIVAAHAGTLLARGRWRTVLNWLEGMPEDVLRANPWLLYWKGMARAGTDGPGGRAVLESAFAAFAGRNDVRGKTLACAAIIDSYFQEWNTVSALDRWIVEMEGLLAQEGLAEEALRQRALSSMVMALLYRQPAHPSLPGYVREVEQQLHQIDDVNDRLSTAAYLFDYFTLSGDFTRVPTVAALTQPDAQNRDALPINTFLWWQRRGMYGYCAGDFEQAQTGLATALRIARDNGMVDAEFLALLLLGMLMACVGKTDEAAGLLREMRAKLNPKRHMHAQGYHYLDLWLAILHQDLSHARRIWETFSKTPAIGVPTHAAHNHPIAWLLAHDGQGSLLLERIHNWRAALDGMRSPLMEFNLLSMEVCAYRGIGDEPAARNALQNMFAIGAKHQYRTSLTWIPAMMAELCALALEWNVEPTYVRWFIRQRNLQPPRADLLNWPRVLEIRTLGAFHVARDGEVVEFSHKLPRKPLALLKAIVAQGARGLSTDAACERLWPDLDGDAAVESLGSALHRLRRLLGSGDAVRLSERRLTLDESLVWVDAFAFERLLEGDSVTARENALSMYRGDFLPHDEGDSWTAAMRDRLRARFVRLVDDIGQEHEAAGRFDEAIACYRRGIEVDLLAERFYQGSMRCLAQQARRAEGAAVYRQLRQTLSVVLGIAPSPQSEQLGRDLLRQV